MNAVPGRVSSELTFLSVLQNGKRLFQDDSNHVSIPFFQTCHYNSLVHLFSSMPIKSRSDYYRPRNYFLASVFSCN